MESCLKVDDFWGRLALGKDDNNILIISGENIDLVLTTDPYFHSPPINV